MGPVSALPVARLFGFEIRVHVSWAVILAVIATCGPVARAADVEWAGEDYQHTVVPWTLIGNGEFRSRATFERSEDDRDRDQQTGPQPGGQHLQALPYVEQIPDVIDGER